MEKILIEHLEMIAEEIAKEAGEKKEWGHFGNSFGREESRKKLKFWADILVAIAVSI